MALKEATISLDFGQGIDTKTDPKMVVPAKLLTLQNAVFTKAKSLIKRNGYDKMTAALVGGGTLSSPSMARSYRNELLCAATTAQGPRLLSYSESLSAWSDRGKYQSIAVTKQDVASIMPGGANPFGGTTASSAVVLGQYQIFAYASAQSSSVYLSVIDSQTGMHLETSATSLVATPASTPKIVLLGASTAGVLYLNGSGGLLLRIITITAGGGISLSAPITISASFVSTYDVQTTATGAAIAYYTSPGSTISLVTLNTSGGTINTASIASAGLPSLIHLNVDSSTKIWCYWADSTTASSNTLNYAVLSSTLTSILGKTAAASALNRVNNIAALSTSSTQQTVYYSTLYTDNTTPTLNKTSVTTTAASGSSSVVLYNVDIYSRPATVGSRNYMAVVFSSNLAPTGFLIDLADGQAVAKFLPSQAEGIVGTGTATVQRPRGFINNLIALSSTKLFLCSGYLVTQTQQPSINTLSGLIETLAWAVMGTCALTFDFAHADAYQGVIQQDTLVLNGGLVSQYDGASVSELGFSTDPEVIGSTSTGGGIGSGSWLYYATYEWTDANGNRHQSAPSIAYRAVFTSGTTNSVSLKVKSLALTQKTNVQIVLWRTIDKGTVAFRLDSAPNDSTQNYTTLSDFGGTTDTTLQGNEQLYTAGGSIVDNLAPPPAMILWTNNNRLWCIDSENPLTTIDYSKTAAQGSGIAFSTGFLTLTIDSKFGAITGAQPMDEKTVIIKERGLGFFIGDGADDSGSNSTFSSFQVIPSDVGGTSSKSVVLFPAGVLFRSPKGIYALSRGLQVVYFGTAVEAYNSQDITSALITADANQIRFLTSSGESLLFDYVMSQWSTFTNHAGVSADVWKGSYVYVRADGNIFKENATTFLDDTTAYAMVAKTGWLQLNGVQGFQRVKRAAFLGNYANGASPLHKLQASFAYDYSTTFTTPVPYTFGASATSNVFQYRERLPQQKCGNLQLLLEEVTTGASGESININSMGFEAGVKQGLQKFSQNQTVG